MIVPVVIIAAWEAASRTGRLRLEFLSRPSDIVAAGIGGLRDGTILLATWQTFEAALFGLLIATAAGVLAGTILGLSRPIEKTVGPTIEALRPIPAVGIHSAVAVVVRLRTADGGHRRRLRVRLAVPDRRPSRPCAGSSRACWRSRRRSSSRSLTRMRKIILPAALGRINVGVRVAAGFALVVAVTVEIVVNPRGLGYSLILAQQSFRVDLMYAQLLWLGILGYAINSILRTVRTFEPALQGGRPM